MKFSEILNFLYTQNITIIDCASLIVAIVAIIYTSKSLQYQRNHDKLTFKPIPRMYFDLDLKGKLSIILQNQGTGPLIVDNVSFVYKKEMNEDLGTLLLKMNPNIKELKRKTLKNLNSFIISPRSSIELLELENLTDHPKTKTLFSILLNNLSSIKLLLHYKDVYEDKIYYFSTNFSSLRDGS